MQKTDATESGSTTTQMAHWCGEDTTTTADATESGRTTGAMAHWGGEATSTTGSGRGLLRGGTLRAELQLRSII